MNKIHIYMVSLLSVTLLWLCGCADYDEDYGYEISFDSYVTQSDWKAEAGSYSVSLQTRYTIDEGEAEVQEVGFICRQDGGSETLLPGTVADGMIQATATGLLYGVSYEVRPYMVTTAGTQRPDITGYIYHNAADFAPVPDGEIAMSMPEPGHLEFLVSYSLVDYTQEASSATLTFGGQNYAMTLENNIVARATVDLNELPDGTYSSVSVEVSNAFGSNSIQRELGLSVSSSPQQYAGDGEREDCIRLCGIDWAKGNLLYEEGVWKIAESQGRTFSAGKQWDTEHVEHFTYGETTGELHDDFVRDWYVFAFLDTATRYSISGDASYDVAAAHLGADGWVLPSSADLLMLARNASWQYAIVTVGNKVVYGYLFYTPGTKRFVCTTPVSIDADDLNGMGLFLPGCGYYNRRYYSEYHFSDVRCLYYMSGEASPFNNYWSNRISNDVEVTILRSNIDASDPQEAISVSDVMPNDYAYASQSQFAVRPVKGTVKADDSNRPVQVTSGSAIDLGLSVRWASCNAGASLPQESGYTYGVTDTPGVRVEGWRTPSESEAQELLTQCEWQWGVLDGVSGYKVTGPSGNSIFLPAITVENELGFYYNGSSGVNRYYFGFSRESRGFTEYDMYDTYTYAYAVRMVCD